jgi:hypothetical protein
MGRREKKTGKGELLVLDLIARALTNPQAVSISVSAVVLDVGPS